MAKSRAEIQKAYRERKKAKDGEKYLKKETTRVKKYYVASSCLSDKDKRKRNKIAAERNRKHRLLIKANQLRDADNSDDDDEETTESGYDSSRLIVKLPIPANNQTSSRRTSRALQRAKRKCKKVEDKVEVLNKRCKKKQKVIERLRAKLSRLKSPVAASTPRSRTNSFVDTLNLTPKRADCVKRKLLLGNVLIDEITHNAKLKKKSSIVQLISGKITKKYRCIRGVSKITKIACRQTFSKHASRDKLIPKVATRRCQKDVVEFLNRPDNSRTNPGKKDVKLCNGEKKQTKVLTDYLSNLYSKFLSENPTYVLSLATFCRLRPQNILTVKFTTRQACLCIRHQNAALKLKALKKLGVSVNENPEYEQNLNDRIDDITIGINDEKDINYNVWKRVESGGLKKMKIVNENKPKGEFIDNLKVEFIEFDKHVTRMKEQYNQMRYLKDHTPPNHFIVQMDFSENYTCRSVDEIQSAYWNQSTATLHPIVAYYKTGNVLNHKSYVVISDEQSHNAATVWAIIDLLVPELKKLDEDISCIHYWTDSPSSQYRNKNIFHVVANHRNLYGFPAKWNYFEAGHGKGPCDGLGGTTKRLADEAMRMGAAVIQDASDLLVWATTSNMREVDFLWLSKRQCKEKQDLISQLRVKPVKGTMRYHAVVGFNTSTLYANETSCYCQICLHGGTCDSWKLHHLDYCRENAEIQSATNIEPEINIKSTSLDDQKPNEQSSDDQATAECRLKLITNNAAEQEAFEEGDFVACVYDQKWYIGKILELDVEDVNVSFMAASRDMFKWPDRSDEIWVRKEHILSKIEVPIPSGKSNRLFKIGFDREKIQRLFDIYVT